MCIRDSPREGPLVDAIVHFDPRNFAFIHDSEDMYHGTVQLWMAAYTDDGRSTIPLERDYKLTLRPAEYRYSLEYGLGFSLQIKLCLLYTSPSPRDRTRS